MTRKPQLVDVDDTNFNTLPCCGIKSPAHPGREEKHCCRKIVKHSKGLTIIRSRQCPYIAKFTADIAQIAEEKYHLKPKIVEIKSWRDAQNAPTPYAVFSVIYDGRLLADHQISSARFRNIMNKCLAGNYAGAP